MNKNHLNLTIPISNLVYLRIDCISCYQIFNAKENILTFCIGSLVLQTQLSFFASIANSVLMWLCWRCSWQCFHFSPFCTISSTLKLSLIAPHLLHGCIISLTTRSSPCHDYHDHRFPYDSSLMLKEEAENGSSAGDEEIRTDHSQR